MKCMSFIRCRQTYAYATEKRSWNNRIPKWSLKHHGLMECQPGHVHFNMSITYLTSTFKAKYLALFSMAI